MRRIDRIIVHCSDTRVTGWFAGLTASDQINEIHRWHTEERGFSQFGYHVYIRRDGRVCEPSSHHLIRAYDSVGAHCKGLNAHSIGVCLEGGHGCQSDDLPTDNFTAAQLSSLRNFIDRWKNDHGSAKVTGHNDHAAKACPGFNVPRWYAKKQASLTAPERAAGAVKSALPIGGGAGASVAAVGGSLGQWDSNAQIILAAGLVALAGFAIWGYFRND